MSPLPLPVPLVQFRDAHADPGRGGAAQQGQDVAAENAHDKRGGDEIPYELKIHGLLLSFCRSYEAAPSPPRECAVLRPLLPLALASVRMCIRQYEILTDCIDPVTDGRVRRLAPPRSGRP